MARKTGNSEHLFPESDFDTLRAAASASVRALSKEPNFLRKPKVASLLFSWAHLADFDEVSAWLKSRLKHDEAVLEVAAIMPSEVYSTPGGLWHRIDRQSWSLLLDVDDFTKRLRKIGNAQKRRRGCYRNCQKVRGTGES